MNGMPDFKERVWILDDALFLMEKTVDRFHGIIGSPVFIREIGKEHYQYENPTSRHFQFLKVVRIVSGLNAYRCLLEKGYVQELGVITRTIYDYIDEIEFVQEAHESGKPTSGQKKIVDDFFRATPKTADELLKDISKRSRVTKKEIFSSIGRFMSQFSKPERTQKIMSILHNTYSGYVHGDYLHIMEMYNGHDFHLRGMLGTPREDTFRLQFVMLIYRSLNCLVIFALSLGLTDLSASLREKCMEIEQSGLYRPQLRAM